MRILIVLISTLLLKWILILMKTSMWTYSSWEQVMLVLVRKLLLISLLILLLKRARTANANTNTNTRLPKTSTWIYSTRGQVKLVLVRIQLLIPLLPLLLTWMRTSNTNTNAKINTNEDSRTTSNIINVTANADQRTLILMKTPTAPENRSYSTWE